MKMPSFALRLAQAPVSPVLVGVFFVLYHLNGLHGHVAWLAVAAALGIVSGVGAGLLWALRLVARSPAQRAVVLAPLLACVYFYHHLAKGINLRFFYDAHLERGVLAALLLGGAAYLLAAKRLPEPRTLNRFYNLALAALCLYELLVLGGHLARYDGRVQTLFEQFPPAGATAAPPPPPSATRRPNIYLLLPDAYPSEEVLQEFWRYPNHAFTDSLQSLGFFYAKHSRSNYNLTVRTMASAFNLQYLDSNALHYPSLSISACLGRIRKNTFVDTLYAQGYRIHNLSSFDFAQFPALQKWPWVQRHSNFLELLLGHTPYEPVILTSVEKLAHSGDPMADLELKMAAAKQVMAQQAQRPLFLYCHLLSTHHPTDMNGNGVAEPNPYPAAQAPPPNLVPDMVMQVQATNQALLQWLKNHDWKNDIVLIMSDHGPKLMVRNVSEAQRRHILYHNLTAVYFPDGDYRALHHGITPINLMRAVLNKAIGTRFEPLPERSGL